MMTSRLSTSATTTRRRARWWRSVPSPMPLDDDLDAARRHLVAEARLLDDERLDDWLAGWAPDGILWVPTRPASHPGADQSFFLDDVRRLRERVKWRRQSSAWSQHPPRAHGTVGRPTSSHTSRDDGALHVRSSLTIVETARPAEPHVGRSPVPRARAGERGRRPPSTHQGDLHPRAHCRGPAPGSGPVSRPRRLDDLISPAGCTGGCTPTRRSSTWRCSSCSAARGCSCSTRARCRPAATSGRSASAGGRCSSPATATAGFTPC